MSKPTYEDVLGHPDRWLSGLQRRWLRSRGIASRFAYACLYAVNWICIRLLFRFSVEGKENLPDSCPFIMAPNHSSVFDPPLLAAALPLSLLQQTYWAGKQTTVLRNRIRHFSSWLTRVIPISEESTALAVGVAVLKQHNHLVWFPEGRRSLDGHLQEFKPGIALLLTRCDVPVVPVFIDGAYAAHPSASGLPRFRSVIVVRIGTPQTAQQLGLNTSSDEDIQHAVNSLRQCVLQLREQ